MRIIPVVLLALLVFGVPSPSLSYMTLWKTTYPLHESTTSSRSSRRPRYDCYYPYNSTRSNCGHVVDLNNIFAGRKSKRSTTATGRTLLNCSKTNQEQEEQHFPLASSSIINEQRQQRISNSNSSSSCKHYYVNDDNVKINHQARQNARKIILLYSIMACVFSSSGGSITIQPPCAYAIQAPPAPLSQTDAFRQLPRERRLSQSQQQLEDLKNLQDSRLDLCAERGIFWEQCFMFGLSTSENDQSLTNSRDTVRSSGLDSQLLSPMGALEPKSKSSSSKPPTW